MDTDGVIYRAKNQPIDVAAYHAGASEWRGEPRLSLLCMGIEICCAGKLDEKGFSWFGEYYPTELRRASSAKDNIKAGLYHRYTPQQETSLVALCTWAKQVIPGFDFNWVVGHDEIAPKRKSDPGASLSMSMPAFREKLKAEFSKVG
jgi:N-acetylmuramoyl-L-alanine amidase